MITLVIIGVIAAITVPTLITKYQKEQTVTRLKKAYSALSQTTQRAIADYGPMKTWEIGEAGNADDAKIFFNKYMAPYLSISVPSKTKDEGNWNSSYYFLKGTETTFDNAYVRTYLQDGTSVTYRITISKNIKIMDFYIDINGDKKPNKIGRDIFPFRNYIQHDKWGGRLLPAEASGSRESEKDNCNKNASGSSCTALIMKDGWRIADDYPW